MTIDQIKDSIREIDEDIRAIQIERGSQIVFDPNSEASRLIGVRINLIHALRQMQDEMCF